MSRFPVICRIKRIRSTAACLSLLTCLYALGCGDDPPDTDLDASARGDASSGDAPAVESRLQVHFLYVHGVKSCPEQRMNAERSLVDLEAAMAAELGPRIAAYEAAHPGVTVVTSSARANLYTAESSGMQPSDSSDPLLMDDWEVGDPGCATTRQGEPCTTGYEWRYRLAREIDRLFPTDARNIVIVGHSTGVRAAFEVAADVGPEGLGSGGFGVQDKIAAVIGLHGMVDALGSEQYEMVGPVDFETGCRLSDFIGLFGDSCAQGNGWCEYASQVSGLEAADWVAENKLALTLTAHNDCGLAPFHGAGDGSLPLDAQASALAVGMQMMAAPGSTFRPAHGQDYGNFCHSAIDTPSNPQHADAVAAATLHILDWLFVDARRVAAHGPIDVPALAYQEQSAVFALGGACPAGHNDDNVQVLGACRHPGFFDGDDHPIDAAELDVVDGADCAGTVSWAQLHDSDNPHAGELYFKTYSRDSPAGALERFALD